MRSMVGLRRLSLRLLPILLVWVESSIHLHAQTYTIADLGALPGNTTTKAYGLNNLGQAVGTSDSGAAIATLFSNGKATNMNTLNASVSVATAISGSGQATGYNIFYSNPSPTFRAFVYSNGSMTDIQSDSLFPSGTQPTGINSSGTLSFPWGHLGELGHRSQQLRTGCRDRFLSGSELSSVQAREARCLYL